MPSKPEYVGPNPLTFRATVISQTRAGVVVRMKRTGTDLTREVWLPRVAILVTPAAASEYFISVPAWLAVRDEPGLIEGGQWVWLPA